MSDKVHAEFVEDPPTPPLDELQQRDSPEVLMVPVPVVTQGMVRVQLVPARTGPATVLPLPKASGSSLQQALNYDRKRSAAILIADVDWQYSRRQSGETVPWYAKVPLVLSHCDEVWARQVPGGDADGTLSIITEVYAE